MGIETSIKRQFKVVGTRVQRPDGIDKVTGRALYGADLSAPGMLVGRILRSPHAHARIVSIDTSAAEALAGVKAVVTSADFADLDEDYFVDVRDNCLARGKVLYDGHAVAAVAATTEAAARDALKLIKVEYEILPHVTDVDEAMKPDAPVILKAALTKACRRAGRRMSPAILNSATATLKPDLQKRMWWLSALSRRQQPIRATSNRRPALHRWVRMVVVNCGAARKGLSSCAPFAPMFLG